MTKTEVSQWPDADELDRRVRRFLHDRLVEWAPHKVREPNRFKLTGGVQVEPTYCRGEVTFRVTGPRESTQLVRVFGRDIEAEHARLRAAIKQAGDYAACS